MEFQFLAYLLYDLLSNDYNNEVDTINQNIILNGNPSKTFFKTVYAKYTNFGMQKFRCDYNGSRELQENNDTTYTFKIPRNGELILDTCLVLDLPDIYSPIIPPKMINDIWKPYRF